MSPHAVAAVVQAGASRPPTRLLGFVLGGEPADLLAAAGTRSTAPSGCGSVVGDDRVGRVEDGLGGPVVLLQQDHRGVGEACSNSMMLAMSAARNE